MRRDIQLASRLLVPGLSAAGTAFAQNGQDWSEPFPPFRVAGNWYYVGSKGAGKLSRSGRGMGRQE